MSELELEVKKLRDRVAELEEASKPKSYAIGMPRIIEEQPRPKYPCSKIGCDQLLNGRPGIQSSTLLTEPMEVPGFIDYTIDPKHNSYWRFCSNIHHMEWAKKRPQ